MRSQIPRYFPALLVVLAACPGDGPTDGGGSGPGHPTALTLVSGSPQQAAAGEAAPAPLVVRAADSRGRAVPGVVVAFTPAAGSGTVSAPTATTDAAGEARVSWTVGPRAGTHEVKAASGTLPPATFTATVTPNGTIAATVSFVDTLVSFRAAVLQDAADGFSRGSALSRRQPSRLAAVFGGAAAAPVPETLPGELVVVLRPEAVGAPARGARTRITREDARVIGERMKAAVTPSLRAGARLRDVSPVLRAARISVDPADEAEAAAELRRNPAVLSVDREGLMHATALPAHDDPLALAQAWHYRMIDAPRAWRRTTGSAGVLVAVVDDGTRFDHPDVAANLTRDGYDFVSQRTSSNGCGGVDAAGDGDGYDPDPTVPLTYDRCSPSTAGGHGLHVAGTIGAVGNNATGMTGVAWTVRIRPVRVLGTTGSGSFFDIAQGILYAAGLPASDGRGGVVQAPSGARIINLSLGGSVDAAVLRDAVAAAAGTGALIVVAAGNDNTSRASYPAVYPEVLAVAAVGPTYQRAPYSNFGPHVGIAAPGGDLAMGDASYGIASTVWNFVTGQPTYAFFQGTSMAAPHVAGAAALLLAQEPTLTAAQLRQRLTAFAVDLGAPGPDPVFGAGVLNVRSSLAQSSSIQGRLFGRVYDASTGAIVGEAQGAGSEFSVGGLTDGAYHVFAGIDDEGDGIFGTNGFRWGAFTSAGGVLQSLDVDGAGRYPAAFSIGYARESEPNDAAASATRLTLGGSLYGYLPRSDVDVYAVTLPAGRYTFETEGWSGSCGMATDADTEITLRSPDGAVLAQHDDVDLARFNFCSRVTATLAAGRYTLSVRGFTVGFYRVLVRAA